MHHERIHVKRGRCYPSRRKYGASDALASDAPKVSLASRAAPACPTEARFLPPLARVFTFGSPFFPDAAGMRPPLFEDRLPAAGSGHGAAPEGADLGYLMPGYRLWAWENFDLPCLVAGELEHWLCVHNKNATQPPDAAHREAERLLELTRARVRGESGLRSLCARNK
jgi:hypothetical protein